VRELLWLGKGVGQFVFEKTSMIWDAMKLKSDIETKHAKETFAAGILTPSRVGLGFCSHRNQ